MAEKQETALLVSVVTPDVTDEQANESMDELERLVTTLGFRVIGKEFQRQPNTTGATAVGSGKLLELARYTDAKPPLSPEQELASVVVFDCDLKPSQLRHLEGALLVEVLDRSGVIIEIFSRHAKTKAARLQVEIARLGYLAPRLREAGPSGERQAGRGSGESALETERRSVRDRLAQLRRELEILQREQSAQRATRAGLPSVALVGYTNAGKSSTMRALTSSDVLVENKLFATLDTTVRAIQPETQPRILVSDTVGFIKKLPHDLVASFRSTLDEAAGAALLLLVVDAADPGFRDQVAVVEEALKEVKNLSAGRLLVLNKCDCLDEFTQKRLQREFPDAVLVSALNPSDVDRLKNRIVTYFEERLEEAELLVPYNLSQVIAEMHASTRILKEDFEEGGTRFRFKANPAQVARLKKLVGAAGRP